MADVLRRWKELGKSYSIQHPIFLDYDNCSFIVEEVEIVKKELTLNEADLQLL